MTTFNIEHVLSRLRASLEANDLNQAVQTLEKLRTPDQAEIFEALPAGDQVALLPQMDPEQSADLLEELEDRDAAGLVRALPREAVARASSRRWNRTKLPICWASSSRRMYASC